MTTTLEHHASSQAVESRTGKYLVFELNGEDCCVHVLKVREIMGVQAITPVPHTPDYLKGVINLRGKVIPVVDLRLKFGMPAIEYSQRTCIIVVHAQREDTSVPLGIVVDSVTEVVSIAASDIEDTPNFGEDAAVPFLMGMAKTKGRVKLLLDIDAVLASHELRLKHQSIKN